MQYSETSTSNSNQKKIHKTLRNSALCSRNSVQKTKNGSAANIQYIDATVEKEHHVFRHSCR